MWRLKTIVIFVNPKFSSNISEKFFYLIQNFAIKYFSRTFFYKIWQKKSFWTCLMKEDFESLWCSKISINGKEKQIKRSETLRILWRSSRDCQVTWLKSRGIWWDSKIYEYYAGQNLHKCNWRNVSKKCKKDPDFPSFYSLHRCKRAQQKFWSQCYHK